MRCESSINPIFTSNGSDTDTCSNEITSMLYPYTTKVKETTTGKGVSCEQLPVNPTGYHLHISQTAECETP